MENDTKKAVDAPTQSTTSAILSTPNLPQNNTKSQAKNTHKRGKKRFKGDDTHALGMDSKVNTLAIKCYAEQLPEDPVNYPGMTGEEILYLNIRATDPKLAQVIAIKHDRDIVTDGIWLSSVVKPHYHILVRLTDDNKRMRVKRILEGLHIVFRPGIDDNLIMNHGLETIGKFAGYCLYLTHETDEAIADAKELYDMSELISNLSIDEIKQVREGYIRVSEKRKITNEELIALDKEAFQMGYELKNFDDWYGGQPFNVRSHAKMKTIKESYMRGAEKRLDEDDTVLRLSVYIQGAGNLGKTYTSIKALKENGIDNVYTVGGGNTGKFDKLRCDHSAIVIDDDVCPNLLNMSDNKMCHAYRRGSNNPIWTGSHFIVTYNEDFEQYAKDCGVKVWETYDDNGIENIRHTKAYWALLSRFFVCTIVTDSNGVSRLKCVKVSQRGAEEEQKERLEMFIKFRDKFNELIKDYQPKNINVDYSSVLE